MITAHSEMSREEEFLRFKFGRADSMTTSALPLLSNLFSVKHTDSRLNIMVKSLIKTRLNIQESCVPTVMISLIWKWRERR